MSFEHCHSCLPPVRYPGCQDHCPHYAEDIAKVRAAKAEESGRRRQKTIIWERASSKRGVAKS
jgi:hypothetical protein